MSGHSKWATIKRKKGAADAKRGKIFTRAIHEITVATREGGGGDPDGNPRLRFAIERAKAVNMPNDTIDRAIKRATGELKDGQQQEELTYEGYGPGGAAILVDVVTDNRNRTVSDVRSAFTKCGGTLGESGSVSWMFKRRGVLTIPNAGVTEEQLMEQAIEAGADDVAGDDGHWVIMTEPTQFHSVREYLSSKFPLEHAELQHIPSSHIELRGEEAQKMVRLLEALEDLDDVLSVSANCELLEHQ